MDIKKNYCFARPSRFSYWAFNIYQNQRLLQQTGIFLKQNPGEAVFTIYNLQKMVANNNSDAMMFEVSWYIANVTQTNVYWHKVKEHLKAMITNVGLLHCEDC